MTPRRRTRCAATGALLLAATAACRPAGVRLAFHPPVGAVFAYHVDATVVTAAGPRHQDRVSLTVVERVLATAQPGTVMDVTVTPPDAPAQTIRVVVDDADQVTQVITEGAVPATGLGPIEVADVALASAAPVPPRRLSPGDRWRVDQPVSAGGRAAGRAQGRASLTRLGLAHGRAVATVETVLDLPADRVVSVAGRSIEVTGHEHTSSTSTRSVRDGAVEAATIDTLGVYRLRGGPAGAATSISITLRAAVERIPPP